MGWMTWERYTCTTNCSGEGATRCINEDLIKAMADQLASGGWREAGYAQVSIDDCWAMQERDSNGRQQPDHTRFPSGMAALGKYIHDRELRFGTYSDIGSSTCAGVVGLKDHFEIDADTFASWGVDYIKVDGCNEKLTDMQRDYPAFGQALNKTGRPIVYSCSWPAYMPHRCEGADSCLAPLIEHCNLWRNYNDISDGWQSVSDIINFWKRNSSNDAMVTAAGPGHWNDPDMLMIGNFGLSEAEEQTQFALWAIFAAPLFMSNDLRQISDSSKAILLNREIIAVNQDMLGKQGYCAAGCTGDLRVWVRELQNGDAAVALQNAGNFGDGAEVSVSVDMLPWFPKGSHFKARDLYQHADLGMFPGKTSVYVHVSSVKMLRLSPISADSSLVV